MNQSLLLLAGLMTGALAHLRVPAHYIGTLGSGVPGGLSATQHTTPDPIRLQAALAEARDAGARAVVMDRHGGTLDFETEVGEGTTFIVRVPIEQNLSEAEDEARPVC